MTDQLVIPTKIVDSNLDNKTIVSPTKPTYLDITVGNRSRHQDDCTLQSGTAVASNYGELQRLAPNMTSLVIDKTNGVPTIVPTPCPNNKSAMKIDGPIVGHQTSSTSQAINEIENVKSNKTIVDINATFVTIDESVLSICSVDLESFHSSWMDDESYDGSITSDKIKRCRGTAI